MMTDTEFLEAAIPLINQRSLAVFHAMRQIDSRDVGLIEHANRVAGGDYQTTMALFGWVPARTHKNCKCFARYVDHRPEELNFPTNNPSAMAALAVRRTIERK